MNTILDVLARIKMGAQTNRKAIRVPNTRFGKQILIHLRKHNLIRGFDWDESSNTFQVFFRNWAGTTKPLEKIKVVSKPSNRGYVTYRKIINLYKKKAHVLISTPYGLRNHRSLFVSRAIDRRIAGEALAIFKH